MHQKVNTLGDWAAHGIGQHLQKVLKHEPEVLKDKDPEELHQMRVGMRRLRSAAVGFAPVLDLPKSAQDKQIGKIASRLGKLRDLDVLLDSLNNRYYPNLPSKEQKALQRVLQELEQRRKKVFKHVQTLLNRKNYKQLKQELQQWLDFPRYTKIEQLPIGEVLPDLLLPQVSELLLHSGWQVGLDQLNSDTSSRTEQPQNRINSSCSEGSPETVELILRSEGEILHDLRKQVKRVRYLMTLFTNFYGATYSAYLQDMKDIQEDLGDIQDSEVLEAVLKDILKSDLYSGLPTFADILAQSRYNAWRKWRVLQRRYLNAEIRQSFRSTLLYPKLDLKSKSL